MTPDIILILIVVVIGVVGWVFHSLLSRRMIEPLDETSGRFTRYDMFFQAYLAGFALCCILLFLLAITGFFTWKGFGVMLLGLLVWCGVEWRRNHRIQFGSIFRVYLLMCLLMGVLVAAHSRWMKPYEAVIMANDTSVYIGTAFQLVRSGSTTYDDPLVQEASPAERSSIFLNYLFPKDPTGRYARFPHGIHLINTTKGTVSFSFYHLFPVWLGFGLKTLAESDFLKVSSIFFMIGATSLFFIGYALRGWILGAALVVLHLVFFPQVYFTRLPMSELLAQALFLSGLWLLIRRPETSERLPVLSQFLAALLWGCMFLTKLDLLFLSCVSLIIVFALIPRNAEDLFHWRIFLIVIFLFLCAAILYQLYIGEYLYVVAGPVQRIAENIPEFRPVARQLHQQGFPPVLLPVLGAAALAFAMLLRTQSFYRFYPKKSSHRMLIHFVIAGAFLFLFIRRGLKPAAMIRHLNWIFVYIPAVVLLFQLGMIGFFAVHEIKQKRRTRVILLLVFLLVPAISYLARPMIVAEQPWSMRRWLPMVFPLLSIISAAGAILFLDAVVPRNRKLAKIFFLAMVLTLAAFNFQKSSFLFREPLFSDLLKQVRGIGESIPPQSIVLVPDQQAGMHFVLPFQYLIGRDSLSLNLESADPENSKRMIAYLNRKIQEGKEIRMMLVNSNDTAGSLIFKHFSPKMEFVKDVSFLRIAPFGEFDFPGHSENLTLSCRVFRILPPDRAPFKSRINYDDPDAAFLKFHEKENGFRWTSGESEITNFQFPTNNQLIRVIVRIRSEASHTLKRSDLKLLVNQGISAKLLETKRNQLEFVIDGTGMAVIRRLVFQSKTFVPSELKLNQDPRTLGIPFMSVEFQLFQAEAASVRTDADKSEAGGFHR